MINPMLRVSLSRGSVRRCAIVACLGAGLQVQAQTPDEVFSKYLAATSGWQNLSYSTSMTTRMMGRTTTVQSRTALDRSGRSYQGILSGPMRVAMVVRGDTVQSKDLQTGKLETRVVPGGGGTSLQQMDPGARLFAIRQANRFQVESRTVDQTVVHGVPIDPSKGHTEVRITFSNATSLPASCDLLDSAGRATARMEFGWEQHGTVQVMKSMKMTTSPSGKTPGMEMQMEMSSIRVDGGLTPATFQLREGK